MKQNRVFGGFLCMIITSAGLSAFWTAPAAGQDALRTHPRVANSLGVLEAWLEGELEHRNIPGISVGIVYDQELVWADGFGWADPDARVPATPTTLYHACSLVKPITAMAVLQLRDRGLVSLDDPVTAHLDWFQVEDPFQADPSDSITLAMLLTHSSGLPRDLPLSYWTGPDYPFPTREVFEETMPTLRLTHPPGTRHRYSSVGLTLAGEVVSTVSGMPYARYVQRNIFDPIGMEATSIDPRADVTPRLASGYSVLQRDRERMRIPPYRLKALAPAAGLVTSVEDMARFVSWQFRTLDGRETAVLSRGTLRSMHQVQWMDPDGWGRSGYGYQTWAENDRHFVGHAGACPGYETKILMRPTERLAVLVMTNAQGPDVDGYAQRIYDLISPALRTAATGHDGEEAGTEWAHLEGRYVRPYGGEVEVRAWGEGLAILPIPTGDPRRAMEVLDPMGEGMFGPQGGLNAPADLVRFERQSNGDLWMWRDHQYYVQVHP